jgi:hypothetical protein
MKLLIMQSSPASCHFLPLRSKYSPQHPVLRHHQSVSFPQDERYSFTSEQHDSYSLRPGREAEHSPPSSAELKNAWRYTSNPPIRLHGAVLS